MTIPPYALLVFGQNFGGWYWPSITPHGRNCFWIALFVKGESNQRFVRVNSMNEVEMYLDAVEDIGDNEPK